MVEFINSKALFSGKRKLCATLSDVEQVRKRNVLNPELPIREVVHYYAPSYGIRLGIITVSVNTGFDNFHLRDC